MKTKDQRNEETNKGTIAYNYISVAFKEYYLNSQPQSEKRTVNDDQQDATILAYFFIPNQLYMFRAMHLTVFTASDIVH